MLSFKSFITEKRSNSEKNPKVDVYQQILDLFGDRSVKTLSEMRKYFFSFTDVEKIGINPRSKYDTPLGIYFYPGALLFRAAQRKDFNRFIPFATDRKYIQVAKVRESANVVYLDEVTQEMVVEYAPKLFEMIDADSSLLDPEAFVKLSRIKAAVDHPGGRLWWMFYYVAMVTGAGKAPTIHSRQAAAWNGIMRKLGIDGVVDPGLGIIHENEPTQAVFFNKTSFDHVGMILNKVAPAK